MIPYIIIGVIIFVLGCVRSWAIYRRKAAEIAVAAAFLEAQARAARDQQIVRDRNKP